MTTEPKITAVIDDSIDRVVKLSGDLTIPAIKSLIYLSIKLLTSLKPSPMEEIRSQLNEINGKLDNIYNVVSSALIEDDIRQLDYANLANFEQIHALLSEQESDQNEILGYLKQMVFNLTIASFNSNEVLKKYTTRRQNDSGDLITFIGGFAYHLHEFYRMYALVQHAINRVAIRFKEQQLSDALRKLEQQQQLIHSKMDSMLNQALGRSNNGVFDFDYPDWCKNVFTQGTVKITNEDNKEIKYGLNNPGKGMMLSQSYVKGEVCAEFKIVPIEYEDSRCRWKLLHRTTGAECDAPTQVLLNSFHQMVDVLTYSDATNQLSEFVLKYKGNTISIHPVEENGRTAKERFWAGSSGPRTVGIADSGYRWKIVSL